MTRCERCGEGFLPMFSDKEGRYVLCPSCRKSFDDWWSAGRPAAGTGKGTVSMRLTDWAGRFGAPRDRVARWFRLKGIGPSGTTTRFKDARGVMTSARNYVLDEGQRKELAGYLDKLSGIVRPVGRKRGRKDSAGNAGEGR